MMGFFVPEHSWEGDFSYLSEVQSWEQQSRGGAGQGAEWAASVLRLGKGAMGTG